MKSYPELGSIYDIRKEHSRSVDERDVKEWRISYKYWCELMMWFADLKSPPVLEELEKKLLETKISIMLESQALFPEIDYTPFNIDIQLYKGDSK
jgi:uncharacterized protein YecA (UPF0149 family)